MISGGEAPLDKTPLLLFHKEEISTKAKQDKQLLRTNRLGLYSHPPFPSLPHSLSLLRSASLCLHAPQQKHCLAPGGVLRELHPGASQAYAERPSSAICFSFSGFSHLFAVACDCFL